MKAWSLKRRLLRNVLVAVGIGWGATLCVGIFALNHEMGEILDDALKDDATLIARLLAQDKTRTIAEWADAHPDGDDWRLRILHGTAAAPAAPWPDLTRDGVHTTEGWQVIRRSTDDGVIEIGQSLAMRRHELMEAARAFLFLILPLLLLVTAAIMLTLRQSLSSTVRFSEGMRRRSAEDLSPLVSETLPQEMTRVAEAFNIYLARIQNLREAERHFIANAAHELRTPLAVLRSRIEVMAAAPERLPEAQADLMGTIDRLSLRVERLLQLERAEAGLGLARETIDVIALIRLVCHDMRPVNTGQMPILFDDSDIEALQIESDRDALAIILRNLLGNAREHGTGEIRLRLAPDGTLTVTNQTSGQAGFQLDRGDRSASSKGAGLGLDITRRLAQDLGIAVTFAMQAGPPPQARVTLHLPLAPAAPVRD
ncbi:sensor histidine kinase [Thioclava kandeliae]|uniref:histidine kinase n=1 Tax=Thioclava kandeliae TaxID=3070818 RepID=A0ABV1SI17_9RHOB